ncbi:MAG: PAS domain S-box protein [Chlorobiales bacterium]|nr:PAS domain S-box protein [Chlorobiales bacterium]
MTNTHDTEHLLNTIAELQKRLASQEERLLEQERIKADRERAEEALRQSEVMYRSLFKNMLNGAAYCRMLYKDGKPDDFIYLSVNDAVETLIGVKDVVGKRITELVPGVKETDPELFEIFGRVAMTGQTERFERYVEALQQLFSVSVYSPEKDHFAVVYDVITKRKRDEKDLQTALTKYKTLFESFPLGITVSDSSGQILQSNRMAEKLLGLSPEEQNRRQIDGIEWRIIRPDGSPMPAEEYASVRALKEKRLIENMELGIVKPSGAITWLSVTATPLSLPGYGVVITYGDITERKQAEQALRESEAKLRLFIEHAPASLAMFDRDMRYLTASNRWRSSHGMGNRDFIGHSHDETFPEVPERWKEAHRRGLSGEVVKCDEDRLERPDGSVQWLYWEVRPWQTSANEIGGIVIFCEDITERKRAEEALLQQKSAEQFRSFVEGAPDAIIVQADQRISYMNPAACRLFGVASPDQLLGQPIIDRIHPSMRTTVKERIRVANEEKRKPASPFEQICLRVDGDEVHVEVSAEPIVYEGKNGALVFFRDITERKRTEAALRESEALFQSIIKASPDDITITDIEGRIRMVSPSALTMFRHAQEEDVMGHLVTELIVSEDHERARSVIGYMLQGGISGPTEYRGLRADGCVFDIEVNAEVIRDAAGQPTGIVSIVRDITERKRAEQALRESEQNYREIFNATNEAIFLHDAVTGYVVDVNNTTLLMFGYKTKEEIQACPPGTLSAKKQPYTGKEVLSRIHQAVEQGTQVFEWLARKKNGDLFWVEVSLHSTRIGGEGRVLAVIRDITERKRAEKALQQSEQNYREIFNATSEAIFLHDAATGRILDANDTTVRLYGYDSKEEILRGNIGDFSTNEPPYTQTEGVHRIRLAVEEGPQVFEWQAKKKNGERFWVEVSLQNTQIGGEGCILAVIRDITERKRAEAALRESEELYRSTLKASPDSITITDLEGRIRMGSPAALKLFGSTHEEQVLGHMILEFVAPEDHERVHSSLALIHQGAFSGPKEYHGVRADGSVFEIESNGELIRDALGQPTGIVIITRDITERKRAEKKLRESEMLFQSIVKASPDIVTITDLNGRLRMVSKSALTILGYRDYPNAIGQPITDFLVPEDRERAKANMVCRYQGTLTGPSEYQGLRADGSVFDVESNAEPIRDAAGQPTGIVIIIRDITERKRAEAEREKLQTELAQAQKMEFLGRLAGGIAHDFNNLLSIIMGYTELSLSQIDPSDPICPNLHEILHTAKRSADIIQQLLTFARKQTVSPKVVDLNNSVASLIKGLRRLIGENIVIHWQPSDLLWNIKIDLAQIDQLLLNLSVNARDAIKGVGNISIKTDNITIDEAYCANHKEFVPGEFVLLEVSDDGSGMNKDALEHIFEPFFTTKEFGHGSGLGMATVYGIVKQNNGIIAVNSEPGKGTTVRIYLPRHEALTVETKTISEGKIPVGHGETILLVEDEEAILNTLKKMLEQLGYTPLIASLPTEALRLVKEYPSKIGLLITDVIMPEMNGSELAKELHRSSPDMKILFMSGYAANVIAESEMQEEGANFLQKPFTMMDMARKIREVMDKK